MITLELTSSQLCNLVDMPFKRFETLRRRSNEALEQTATSVDVDAIAAFPVRETEPGKWSRFNFEDALQLSCCLKLEHDGLEWKSACHFVLNAGARTLLERRVGDPDFWITRNVHASGEVGHGQGSMNEAMAKFGEGSASLVALNVSAVARALVAKIAERGLAGN